MGGWEAHKARGNELFRSGSFVEAGAAYEAALAAAPAAGLERARLLGNLSACAVHRASAVEVAALVAEALDALGEDASADAAALRLKLRQRRVTACGLAHPDSVRDLAAMAVQRAAATPAEHASAEAAQAASAVASLAPIEARCGLWDSSHPLVDGTPPPRAARAPRLRALFHRAWAADAASGALYAFSGSKFGPPGLVLPSVADNSLWALEPTDAGPCWRCLHAGGTTSAPSARAGGTLVAHGGALWLWGGRVGEWDGPPADRAVWRFDLEALEWARLHRPAPATPRAGRGGGGSRARALAASEPEPREHGIGCVRGEGAAAELVVGFGDRPRSGASGVIEGLPRLWAYRLATREWRPLEDARGSAGGGALPSARRHALAWSHRGRVFVYGGELLGLGGERVRSVGDFWCFGPPLGPGGAAAPGEPAARERWTRLPALGEWPRDLSEAACATCARGPEGAGPLVLVCGGYFNNGTVGVPEAMGEAEAAERRPPWELARLRARGLDPRVSSEGYLRHCYALCADSLLWLRLPAAQDAGQRDAGKEGMPALALAMVLPLPPPRPSARAPPPAWAARPPALRLLVVGGYGFAAVSELDEGARQMAPELWEACHECVLSVCAPLLGAPWSEGAPGARVALARLDARPELNARVGRVVRPPRPHEGADARAAVELRAPAATVRVRLRQLERLDGVDVAALSPHDARLLSALGAAPPYPRTTAVSRTHPHGAERADVSFGGATRALAVQTTLTRRGGEDGGVVRAVDVYDGPLSVRGVHALQQLGACGVPVLTFDGGRTPLPAWPDAAALASECEATRAEAERLMSALSARDKCHGRVALYDRRSLDANRARGRHAEAQRVSDWMAERRARAAQRNRAVISALGGGGSGARAEGRAERALVLRVSLLGVHPHPWRELEVPAEMSLRQLADQVLAPALGWPRNYKLWAFRLRCGEGGARALLEGAGAAPDAVLGDVEPMPLCFGPAAPQAEREDPLSALGTSRPVDGMHECLWYGGALCPDTKVRVGQLLRAPADALEWVYDLGDAHTHLVQCAALRERASAGEDAPGGGVAVAGVRLLDGAGAPLPVDCGPVCAIAAELNGLWPGAQTDCAAEGPAEAEHAGGDPAERPIHLLQTQRDPPSSAAWWGKYNEIRQRVDRATALSGPDAAYHPLAFDAERTRAALARALRAPPSPLDASKFTQTSPATLHSQAPTMVGLADGGRAAGEQASRARERTKACAGCGGTANLSACSKCRGSGVVFCSQACLKAAWPTHRVECKRWREERQAAATPAHGGGDEQ